MPNSELFERVASDICSLGLPTFQDRWIRSRVARAEDAIAVWVLPLDRVSHGGKGFEVWLVCEILPCPESLDFLCYVRICEHGGDRFEFVLVNLDVFCVSQEMAAALAQQAVMDHLDLKARMGEATDLDFDFDFSEIGEI